MPLAARLRLALLPLTVLLACGDDGSSGGGAGAAGGGGNASGRTPISKDGITLKPEAVVLEGASLAAVRELSRETGRLVVGPGVKLVVGDVVVSGTSPTLPEGMLRRVTEVRTEGDTLVAQTTQASLKDLVADGRLATTVPLKKSGVAKSQANVAGVTPQALPSGDFPGASPQDDAPTAGDGLVLGLSDVVLRDGDGDGATTDDRLVLSGSVGIEPSLDFVFDASLTGIDEASASLVLKGNLTYDLRGPYGASFDQPFTLATYAFTPIVVQIGPVPLVFVPSLDIVLRASGELSVAIAATGTAKVEGRAGVGYVDGAFEPILEGSASHENTKTALAGKASAKLEAGPDFSVLLYGVAGPKASVHAYAQAKGDTSQTPCWRLSAGIEARASLDLSAISIFGFGLKDYATEPYGKDFPIAEGACDPASQGLNPNAEAFAFTLADPSPSSLSATAVLALPDGSWVVAGRGSSALHLYRVRPDGTLAWQKGFSDTFGVAGLALAADGRILLGGDHVLSPWMAKVDLDGKLLWSKTYGPNVSDVRSFVRSPTGISLLAGEAGGVDKAYDDFVLAVNDDGVPQWANKYEGGVGLRDVRPISDGFVVVGDAIVKPSNAGHVMRLANDGSVVWSKTYAGSIQYLRSIDVLADGSFASAGLGVEGGQYLRLAGDGTILASRHVYDPTDKYLAHDFDRVRALPGGGVLLGGQRDFGNAGDALLVAVGSDDIIRYATAYGGAKEDSITQLMPLPNGVFVLADSYTFEDRRGIWGFRTNEVGTIELATPLTRRALTLGFDKPGAIRQGTKDDTLGDVAVAGASTKATPVTFSESNGGKDFGTNDKQSVYAKR